MAEATQSDRSSRSFGSRWALPILLGSACGLLCVVILMHALVSLLGDVLGGALSSLAGIGLGFAVSVAANRLCQLIGRALFAEIP